MVVPTSKVTVWTLNNENIVETVSVKFKQCNAFCGPQIAVKFDSMIILFYKQKNDYNSSRTIWYANALVFGTTLTTTGELFGVLNLP